MDFATDVMPCFHCDVVKKNLSLSDGCICGLVFCALLMSDLMHFLFLIRCNVPVCEQFNSKK